MTANLTNGGQYLFEYLPREDGEVALGFHLWDRNPKEVDEEIALRMNRNDVDTLIASLQEFRRAAWGQKKKFYAEGPKFKDGDTGFVILNRKGHYARYLEMKQK
jgi:hypothetical protein